MTSALKFFRRVVTHVALAGIVCCSSASGQDGDTKEDNTAATRQYAAAVALQNREVYDLASDEWRTFLEKFPDAPRAVRARHYLGICELKRGRYDEAQAAFRQVIADDPKFDLLETTYLYLGVAQFRLANGDKPEQYDAAAASFAEFIKKFPNSEHVPQAWFYEAECLYERGKKQEAARAYAQIVQNHANSGLAPDATYALGVCQEELGQTDAARRTYRAFLSRFGRHPLATEVVMRRGEAEFAAGEFALAEKSFAEAARTEGFPLADHATIRRAACLVELQDYTRAAQLYAFVTTKFPDSKYKSFARLWAGKCAFFAGKYDESREYIEPLLKDSEADTAEVAHWIASGLLKEGKPSDALRTVESALRHQGDSPFAVQLQLDRADALYELPERRGEAGELYARIAEQHADDALAPQALYMAGFTALATGNDRNAVRYATAFLDRYPKDELLPDVIHVAADGNMRAGQSSAAEALYRRLIDEYPTHDDAAEWHVRRGLALYAEKKYAETIDALARVIPSLKDPEQLAEAQLLVGESHNKLGQPEKAVGSLTASLQANASWRRADEALLELADAQRQLQQWDAAKARVTELLKAFPKSRLADHAHFRLAEYAYATGDYQTATAEYQTVVKNAAESELAPQAYYGLGWAHLERNEPQQAIDAFTALVDQHTDHAIVPQARYARAVCLHQTKQNAAAIEDLRASLAGKPSDKEAADARYLLGLCQVGLKEHAQALDTFRELLADEPDYPKADQAYYELAWSHKALKQDDESARAFADLAAKFPDSSLAAESLFHVGDHLYADGDFERAAAFLDASREKAKEPTLKEKALHKLGWAFFRLDRLDQAVEAFAEQRSAYPAGKLAADGAFALAECLFRQEEYPEAVDAYAAVKSPSNDEFVTLSLLHTGQSLNQMEQWEKASEQLNRCVDEYPKSSSVPAALYELAWANQNLGRTDEALKLYEAVTAKTNTEVAARARFMIGEIYFDKKDHREATRNFFKVAYGYAYPEWQAAAHFEAGRCFEVLGKHEQAKKSYLEVVNKFPESDKAEVAQERIDALTNR